MTAAEIATALGHARRSGQWWRCVCPVHGSRTGHSLTLALRDGDRGIVVRCHADCDTRVVLGELRCMGLLAGRSDGSGSAPVTIRSDDRADTARRIEIARCIWDAARDARGSPVVRYLAGRGITIPVPPPLRWAPSLRRPDGTYAPAIVARVDSRDGELIGVHRAWLDRGPDGVWQRRDRASLGPIGGGAVRLAPAAATLLIGEGIETCLAAMQATGMPGWAALSTSGMVALGLPPGVRAVVILADHDASHAGERAAHIAARRWVAEGRRVQIYMSPHVGEDAADRLVAAGTGGARHAA